METIQIPCPKCQSELRLNDRKLLGRKGKCPKCQYVFVLTEPAEVVLDLVQPDTSSQTPEANESPAQFDWAPSKGTKGTENLDFSALTQGSLPADEPQLDFDRKGIGPGVSGSISSDGAAARYKEIGRKNARRRRTAMIAGVLIVVSVGAIAYFAIRSTQRTETSKRVTHVPGQTPASTPQSQDGHGEPLSDNATNADSKDETQPTTDF
ncbi:MAG: hypothetical protein FJ267_11320, partial [Planctomycetes bacterium]|nr:hypothetical protein [Planctomycetota bacterium]